MTHPHRRSCVCFCVCVCGTRRVSRCPRATRRGRQHARRWVGAAATARAAATAAWPCCGEAGKTQAKNGLGLDKPYNAVAHAAAPPTAHRPRRVEAYTQQETQRRTHTHEKRAPHRPPISRTDLREALSLSFSLAACACGGSERRTPALRKTLLQSPLRSAASTAAGRGGGRWIGGAGRNRCQRTCEENRIGKRNNEQKSSSTEKKKT